LRDAGFDWMNWGWIAGDLEGDGVNIDGHLYPADLTGGYFKLNDLSPGQNYTIRIYNATDYGELVCFLNEPVIPWTPDINPSVQGKNDADYSMFIWIGLGLLAIFVLFRRS
jgi:hypothetical protein